MQLADYQEFTKSTAVYPKQQAFAYLALGLGNEAGEVQGKVKKLIRGDFELTAERKEQIVAECGDVFWYLVRLLDEFEVSAEACLQNNFEKLSSRKERNALKGEGDNR